MVIRGHLTTHASFSTSQDSPAGLALARRVRAPAGRPHSGLASLAKHIVPMESLVPRHPGGAPKKSAKDRLDHAIKVRFKPAEYRGLHALKERTGLSISELCRRAALGLRVAAPVDAANVTQWANLGRLGSNLNQCVHQLYKLESRLRAAEQKQLDLPAEELRRLLELAEESKALVEQVMPVLVEIRALLMDTWDGGKA